MRAPLLVSAAALALGLTLGCREAAEAPPAPSGPAPVVTTSSAAAFEAVRRGPRPAFRRGDQHVFVNPAAADLDLGLPGVAFGDARGPAYGLLGGYFAPLVLTPDSRRDYAVRIDSSARGLRIVFEGGPDLEVLPSGQVVLRGDATLAFAADDAEVQGTYRGEPAVAFRMKAGGTPSLERKRADRIVVRSARKGTFSLETTCPRWDLTKAVPKGSTSVFLVHVGPSGQPADGLYAPEIPPPPPDRAACAGTTTSTLVRHRGG